MLESIVATLRVQSATLNNLAATQAAFFASSSSSSAAAAAAAAMLSSAASCPTAASRPPACPATASLSLAPAPEPPLPAAAATPPLQPSAAALPPLRPLATTLMTSTASASTAAASALAPNSSASPTSVPFAAAPPMLHRLASSSSLSTLLSSPSWAVLGPPTRPPAAAPTTPGRITVRAGRAQGSEGGRSDGDDKASLAAAAAAATAAVMLAKHLATARAARTSAGVPEPAPGAKRGGEKKSSSAAASPAKGEPRGRGKTGKGAREKVASGAVVGASAGSMASADTGGSTAFDDILAALPADAVAAVLDVAAGGREAQAAGTSQVPPAQLRDANAHVSASAPAAAYGGEHPVGTSSQLLDHTPSSSTTPASSVSPLTASAPSQSVAPPQPPPPTTGPQPPSPASSSSLWLPVSVAAASVPPLPASFPPPPPPPPVTSPQPSQSLEPAAPAYTPTGGSPTATGSAADCSPSTLSQLRWRGSPGGVPGCNGSVSGDGTRPTPAAAAALTSFSSPQLPPLARTRASSATAASAQVTALNATAAEDPAAAALGVPATIAESPPPSLPPSPAPSDESSGESLRTEGNRPAARKHRRRVETATPRPASPTMQRESPHASVTTTETATVPSMPQPESLGAAPVTQPPAGLPAPLLDTTQPVPATKPDIAATSTPPCPPERTSAARPPAIFLPLPPETTPPRRPSPAAQAPTTTLPRSPSTTPRPTPPSSPLPFARLRGVEVVPPRVALSGGSGTPRSSETPPVRASRRYRQLRVGECGSDGEDGSAGSSHSGSETSDDARTLSGGSVDSAIVEVPNAIAQDTSRQNPVEVANQSSGDDGGAARTEQPPPAQVKAENEAMARADAQHNAQPGGELVPGGALGGGVAADQGSSSHVRDQSGACCGEHEEGKPATSPRQQSFSPASSPSPSPLAPAQAMASATLETACAKDVLPGDSSCNIADTGKGISEDGADKGSGASSCCRGDGGSNSNSSAGGGGGGVDYAPVDDTALRAASRAALLRATREAIQRGRAVVSAVTSPRAPPPAPLVLSSPRGDRDTLAIAIPLAHCDRGSDGSSSNGGGDNGRGDLTHQSETVGGGNGSVGGEGEGSFAGLDRTDGLTPAWRAAQRRWAAISSLVAASTAAAPGWALGASANHPVEALQITTTPPPHESNAPVERPADGVVPVSSDRVVSPSTPAPLVPPPLPPKASWRLRAQTAHDEAAALLPAHRALPEPMVPARHAAGAPVLLALAPTAQSPLGSHAPPMLPRELPLVVTPAPGVLNPMLARLPPTPDGQPPHAPANPTGAAGEPLPHSITGNADTSRAFPEQTPPWMRTPTAEALAALVAQAPPLDRETGHIASERLESGRTTHVLHCPGEEAVSDVTPRPQHRRLSVPAVIAAAISPPNSPPPTHSSAPSPHMTPLRRAPPPPVVQSPRQRNGDGMLQAPPQLDPPRDGITVLADTAQSAQYALPPPRPIRPPPSLPQLPSK